MIITRAANQIDMIAHFENGVKCYAKTSKGFWIFYSDAANLKVKLCSGAHNSLIKSYYSVIQFKIVFRNRLDLLHVRHKLSIFHWRWISLSFSFNVLHLSVHIYSSCIFISAVSMATHLLISCLKHSKESARCRAFKQGVILVKTRNIAQWSDAFRSALHELSDQFSPWLTCHP